MATRASPGASAGRYALIVASNEYEDPGLKELLAPAADAAALATVLSDPDIGGFEVTTLLNRPAHQVGEAVEEFFADRSPEDVLLLHFSGHGIKAPGGELYFAMSNTKLRLLTATGIAANFVNRLMSQSRSRRIVLFLDCCYAGAFERGMSTRSGSDIDLESRFEGRGRAVITASGAVEYAFEAGELTESGDPTPSVFTTAMVRGLGTGEADRDQDGYVDLDELYDYVYGAVRQATPHQTPEKWTYGIQGDLVIARRKLPVTRAAALPSELATSIGSSLPGIRAGAVEELSRLLRGRHQGLALAARQALEELADDDSRTVSAAAAAALAARPDTGASAAPVPPPVAPPAAPTEDDLAPRPPAWSRRIVGRRTAALLVCGVVVVVTGAILAWILLAADDHSTTIPASFDGVWDGSGSVSDGSHADFEARLGEGLSVGRLSSGNSSCYTGELAVTDATDSRLVTHFTPDVDESEGCPDWTVDFTHSGDDLVMHVDPQSTVDNQSDFEITMSPAG